MSPRPSLQQVAEAAGVATGTASKALNGTGSLSTKTRDHVLAIAQDLGYRANPRSANIHRPHPPVLGIVLGPTDSSDSDPGDIYWALFTIALITRAARHGALVTLTDADNLHAMQTATLNSIGFPATTYNTAHTTTINTLRLPYGTPILSAISLTRDNVTHITTSPRARKTPHTHGRTWADLMHNATHNTSTTEVDIRQHQTPATTDRN